MNDFWERLLSQKQGVCYFCGLLKEGDILIEVRYAVEGLSIPIQAHIACAAEGKVK